MAGPILQCHCWGYTVCLCPIKRMQGQYEKRGKEIGKLNHTIRKTCPCNEYPLKPHFYIVKLGFVGVYLFLLFLVQNIDCGYSSHVHCFEQKYKKYPIFSGEVFNFLQLKKSLYIAWEGFHNECHRGCHHML